MSRTPWLALAADVRPIPNRMPRLETGADRLLDAEHAVLPVAPAVAVDDRPHLAEMRRRIEHHDGQPLGALALDDALRGAILAADVEHAEAVGKARRHLLVEERRPLRLADLAAALGAAAEIEID